MLRQLFPPGDDDRHRAAGGHFFKAFLNEIGLHKLRPHFGGNPAGQREVARIAGHLFADAGHRQYRHTVAVAGVHQFDDVIDRLMFVFAADIDLRRHRANVETQRVFHRHRHAFVGEFAQNRIAAGGAEHHRLIGGRRYLAAQYAAGAHQHIGVGKQRRNRQVDTLQPGGWPLEVTVVEGQHDRAVAVRIKNARQPRLHAPVQRAAAFQGVQRVLLRAVEAEVLALFDII